MKRFPVVMILLACSLLIPGLASAAQIRAFVAEFTVTPPEPTLRSTLQTLLASRLASETILPVASPSDADVVVSGSFTQLGKVFSVDAVAKLPSGKLVSTAFEQGESVDDLIPALGRIAGKLKAELPQRYAALAAPQSPAPAPAPGAAAQPAAAAPQASQAGTSLWLSQRIPGAQVGVAPARDLPGGREFFVAQGNAVRLFRQEKTMKLLAEMDIPMREKVIAIDSAGPDKSGNPRAYLTAMDGDLPSSKVIVFKDGKLVTVAQKLPYLFRAIALNGGPRRVYAQEMSKDEDFYGDLYEVPEGGTAPDKGKAIKLPRYANIFNYNTVPGPDGKSYVTLLTPDGYLVVCSDTGEELWRSADKFGGSETYFQRESDTNVRVNDQKYRWRFIDQRISTTPSGEVIVPQNSGLFVIGNNRSYSNYAIFSFTWNGSSLEERWKTKPSHNYLADYYFDPASRELVLLEVVQKEGVFSKGGSAVRVIKAD